MLVGREKEQQQLLNLLKEEEPQFCTLFGRRRVGKTYLVRETFYHHFAFQHTGLAKAAKSDQLREFRESLRAAGMLKPPTPHTWYEAFHLLETFLSSLPSGKKLVFIDELSWMDTKGSDFISALEHFWNGWATARAEKDIVLIVCGSATSWIINKVIKNHGGLHNRVTKQIYLKPFTLRECEQYVASINLQLTRKDIAELYMVMGGIPYYWSFLHRGESPSQAIDRIFFADDAPLANEYDSLYASLFKNPTPHIAIISALASKKSSMLRSDILQSTGLTDNTAFSKAIEELEQCNFIRRYFAFGKKDRDALYQLMDNFTLFYFRFIKPNSRHDANFWSHSHDTSLYHAWSGLAFERLCFWHTPQILSALGISGIVSTIHSWSLRADESHEGAQIDLVIDRNDNVVNICEIKFSSEEYIITKDENDRLIRRISLFRQTTKTRKSLHLTLISPFGATHNQYWNNLQSEITIDALFV